MGVSGSGKSTIAALLADRLGWDFAEGDSFHPAANVEKMSAGVPLTDADRRPWLDAIAEWIDRELEAGRDGVVTCSALKRSYRDRLRRPGVRFVFLDPSRDELERRLAGRAGHYMPASLLDSQLTALEPPTPDEHVITLSGDDPQRSVARIVAALETRR